MVDCDPEDNLFDAQPESFDSASMLRQLFALERFAVLATASEGQPYTYLMAFAATDDLRRLVLVTRRGSRKHEQISGNAHVALLVENCANDPSDTEEAVVVTTRGYALQVRGDEREEYVDLFLNRHPYLADFASGSDAVILRVDVAAYEIITRFERAVVWRPEEPTSDGTVETVPEGAISVIRVGDHEWEFQYERLTDEVYDRFHAAIELYWAGEDATAEAQYRGLIAEYPEFIDAHHHLALLLSYTGRTEEAYEIWYEAVQLGLQHLPQSVLTGVDEIPWVMIENRPFLRAYHALGLEYRLHDAHNLAVKVWERMLSMNSDDNQGIRALAVESYLTLGKDRDALDVIARYPGDIMPETVYGQVLALYRLGREEEAVHALSLAIQALPLVALELAKKRHRKPRDFREERITIGSPEEAYLYWRDVGVIWKRSPGALDFVRTYVEAHPEIGKD